MDTQPSLPIPISYISGSYYLFSIEAVTYLRREHHICGVLIGTLPQIPQQNVFLGLPLELMPEEARLLVEKGVACIVDEVKFQKDGMKSIMEADRQRYLQDIEKQGLQAMRLQTSRKELRREEALKNLDEKKAAKAKRAASNQVSADGVQDMPDVPGSEFFAGDDKQADSNQTSRRTSMAIQPQNAMGITPATSENLLPSEQPAKQLLPVPEVPSSYPLFAHLHSEGYYLSPGLRFGCQYLAYPGDPLRFHSHFLAVSAEWDEEIDLMDIIVGGRLGTGVKKGFLLGGAERKDGGSINEAGHNVRTFSIEWAGM
jgi:tRNA-splicing endonuclease subunit Sen34